MLRRASTSVFALAVPFGPGMLLSNRPFKPFSVRAFQQQGNRMPTPGTAAQLLVAVTPAPSYVTHSAEQQRQAEAGRKVERTPLQKKLRSG
jgi:hypothetical protein